MNPISQFLSTTHSQEEYIKFCREYMIPGEEDCPMYAVFCKAVDRGFFSGPASTKYHGASKGGLVKHSMIVVEELLKLMQCWDIKGTEKYAQEAIFAAFFHDLCKVQLYKDVKKWRKDEWGKWESYLGFDVDTDLLQIGHGEESLRLIEQYYRFEYECWAFAVRYHMGMPDGYIEKQQYMKVIEKYPEVLALHTADMRACISGRY